MNMQLEFNSFSDGNGRARCGTVHTDHGSFVFPHFMPVATRGAVRGIETHLLPELGCQILLANAFHTALKPGDEQIKNVHGSLRKMMGWEGPILTDSGGYQAYSLADMRHIDPETGIQFRSPYDGSYHWYTPERVVQIQANLGSTFMMQLDDVQPYGSDPRRMEQAVDTTLDWYRRSLTEAKQISPEGILVPIVQGGFNTHLRKTHLSRLMDLPVPDVLAMGGLSVGEPRPVFLETLANLSESLPQDKLIYLMGVGRPEDVLDAVSLGTHLVDCVLPTRNGRNGQVFTWDGKLNLNNACHREASDPIDIECKCPICLRYSRSYLHHLYKVNEMNGPMAGSVHNLFFFFDFFSRIRKSIREGKFLEFRQSFLDRYSQPQTETQA
jgi:queuine tRNA-ribosyltransferase